MARFLITIFLFSVLTASAAAAQDFEIETDLGEQGNSAVADAFAGYKKIHPEGICKAEGPGRRVILTGYGLFLGVQYNISGAVVQSMADPKFFPAHVVPQFPTGVIGAPDAGDVSASASGAVGANRSLFIGGARYEVCFLTLDVIWDLAAAIVIDEATRFKPELVFMTGRGGSTAGFEAGAVNDALKYPGFDSAGHPLDGSSHQAPNVPVQSYVLPGDPLDSVLPMNWATDKLATGINSLVTGLGYNVTAENHARPDNNYLCNNISYVLLHAATNRPTVLAGGKLVLPDPDFTAQPVVGFFHFPAVDAVHGNLRKYAEGIFRWAQVLALSIPTALARR